ncbi:multisubunit potassium/proton antiporter, PhaG subunit [Bartonella sp. CDC_skunk]|uniref:Monovalent cation/proton antiporter PhaG n=1 Tax=Bartonella rochalimae ATCC BAA-1498 TaxID=685782 RepID=E6YNP9_9HYPH|nr:MULTISPECIES: monovalent cation/H(+) antiporter subunit G [Bartonella]AQX19007.1 multisubunit potassium/proton antiporter, PhaG subunit [Bartonella sp. A1379B]AQX22014.1 multisubunit potassium/proton antiporter, PhaG subunit [Bartonella sp. CDC_skunk]AQX27288.1 multisubunit potassium/proton antiporter, PhaG subunit [Bartonella sp. Raccoon60]ATO58014.1 multisubunit potassium/proton antiporter, PhaG subunit [Bartonella sp. 1-1C]KEC55271.1 monovalent cation/proton antiporter, MnhG/PhaG subunit
MKDDISLWSALIISFFLILGSSLTLIGTIGLVRFSNFYERLHTSSLSTSWGGSSIIIASFFYSIHVDHVFVIHEILLMIFLFMTTPITSMLLSQTAVHRDQSKDFLKEPLSLLFHNHKKKKS